MDRLAAALGKWVRRYGLAAACLILPWSMPKTWPAQMLMPWQKGDFAFAFRFASPATTPHTAEVAPSPSEPNVTTKQDITPDSLFVQHLSNRVPFALVTGYFYLAAATILVFSSIIIMHYLGCASLLCAMVGYGIAAYALIFISPQQKPFNFELSLAVSDLLDKADKEAILSPLAIPGGTGRAVIAIWKVQLFLGVLPLGLLSLAVSLSSIRSLESDLHIENLKRRLWAIRWALALSSTMLIITVVNVRVLLDWPLTLIEKSQAAILSQLMNIMVFDVAGGSTLILLCLFAPAILAYILDVSRYRALAEQGTYKVHGPAGGDADDGLSLAPLSSLASGLAILAPLLTSPVMELFKNLIHLFGDNH
jgi:hypothetical protein